LKNGVYSNKSLLHENKAGNRESCFNLFISYFQLVTITPTSNCLCLVYRDESTTRFVKYFNDQLCGDKVFYDFDMTYYEGKKKSNEKWYFNCVLVVYRGFSNLMRTLI